MLDEGGSDFQTERLILEPLRREHARHLFPALSDARIYTFIPQDPPSSLLALENRYQQLESRESPDGDEVWLNWAIRLKQQDKYIGTVQATVRQNGSSLLAYEFSPDFWGNGYATESCLRIIESLFADYGVVVVIAEVDTRNAASCNLLERLSFERVSTRKDADFFKGQRSDEHTYRLTSSRRE
ncbi:MAG: [ribosomal protein S5]-alanine N-acetyltransferase [Acidobacteriota bacterium]|nr:[ribosomal protein S5]-alanine N-acetyltransferase [Acidobacteriota bacterium]